MCITALNVLNDGCHISYGEMGGGGGRYKTGGGGGHVEGGGAGAAHTTFLGSFYA